MRNTIAKKIHKMTLLALVLLLVGGLAPTGAALAQDGGRVVFADTFAHNLSRWAMSTSETDGALSVGNNVLALTVKRDGAAVWAMPEAGIPASTEVEVDALVTGNNSVSQWNLALIIRATARKTVQSTFYHFGVNGVGNWEFSKRIENPSSYVEQIKFDKLPSGVNLRRTINLRVRASNNTFTFWVNDQQVGQFTDDSFPGQATTEGYLGLMAGTYTGLSSQTIEFSNLRVVEALPLTKIAANAGEVLVANALNDANKSRWTTGLSSDKTTDVQLVGNALEITLSKVNVLRWSQFNTAQPRNIAVSVEVEVMDPNLSENWGFGIGLLGEEIDGKKHFYLLEITITYQQGGSVLETLQARTPLPNSTFLLTGGRFAFAAQGNNLIVFQGGEEVGRVEMTRSHTANRYLVFLTGGTFEAEKFRVRFSNVRIVRSG
jgi:hypothetical protein